MDASITQPAQPNQPAQPTQPAEPNQPAQRRAFGPAAVALLSLAAFLVVVFGLRETASIVMPVFLAINLVIAARPLHAMLERRGVPRWGAAGIVLLVLYLVLASLVGMLVWAIWIAAEEVPKYSDKFVELYEQAVRQLANFGVSEGQIHDTFSGIDPKTIMSGVGTITNQLTGAGSQLLVLVLAIAFLTFDIPGIARRAHRIRAQQPRLADSLSDFSRGLRSYWIVSTVFGLIVAVIDTVVLMILGVPLALVWGVLAFVTNYIPNIGFVLGLVPPAMFALLTGGPTLAIWVVVAYCVINFVIQSLIQPKFTGDAVGLSASITFLSLIFWAALAGPLGAILAVPLTLAVKAVFVDSDPGMRWFSTFLTTASADAAPDAVDRRNDLDDGGPADPDPAPAATPADTGKAREADEPRQ